jgi:osmotically-inducible protein OsmY
MTLPRPVRDLALRLGANETVVAGQTELTQEGEMKLSVTSRHWHSLTARQTIAVTSCTFSWQARFWPFGYLSVTDALQAGRGRLDVTALCVIPVMRSERSVALTKGELQRYMAELPFAPDAILHNRALGWRVVDANQIAVSCGPAAMQTEVVFALDADGRVASATVPGLPHSVTAAHLPTSWFSEFSDYRLIQGRWVPFSGQVACVIDGVEVPYWRGGAYQLGNGSAARCRPRTLFPFAWSAIMNTDPALKSLVLDELEWEPMVDATHIAVSVRDGLVTLSGHAGSYWQKRAVEQAVARVKGVKVIAAAIVVRLPVRATRSDDEIISAAVNRLESDGAVPRDKVKVLVSGGHVTLSGTVAQAYQRVAAAAAVEPLWGGLSIANEISVMAQPAKRASPDQISDDIRRALNRGWFAADTVHVAAIGGTITLSGSASTYRDRDLAVSTAWAAPGTVAVKNHIRIS